MNDLANFGEYAKLFVGLIAVMNIAEIVPHFLDVTSKASPSQKKWIAFLAAFTAFVVLTIFTVLGNYILELFNISINDIRIAGGAILFLYALKMVGVIGSGQIVEDDAAGSAWTVGVSPLGIPLIAGPGPISTVIVYARIHDSYAHIVVVVVTVLAACALLYAGFRIALVAGEFIGPTATLLVKRAMGLIVGAIAVEFLAAGLRAELFLGLG